MQRVIVEKNEAVADLVERILEVQDREVVLVIPNGSRLTDSPSNFRLIAREAGVLGKEISVESVDQDVLTHAKAAGLAASHPLFDDPMKGGETPTFSDIVPRGAKKKAAVEKKLKVKMVAEPEPEESEPEEEDEQEEDDAETEEGENEPEETEIVAKQEEDENEQYDTLDDIDSKPHRGRKILAWAVVIVVVVAGAAWLTAYAFGKATVNITFQTSPWNYTGTVTASVAASGVDSTNNIVPAELTEPPQTLTKFFPATGQSAGGQKAQGMLTIVNDYSAASQELVATTRFMTPDGHIFHLNTDTVVPGATVVGGKVTASSTIIAAVTADQPGSDYNVPATAHLSIPGFQNTPKANGFYGILASGASGGSSTGGAAPTSQDIATAETQMNSDLNNAFQTTFLASIPGDFKVLPQATTFATTTFSVNSTVNAQGQFSITASTVFYAFEFRQDDLNTLLNDQAQAQSDTSKVLQNLTISYSNVTPNFNKKQMTFTVTVAGTLAPQFNPSLFADNIAGKTQADARQTILGLPDLADAKISLWPSWLWAIPKNPSRIIVNVQ